MSRIDAGVKRRGRETQAGKSGFTRKERERMYAQAKKRLPKNAVRLKMLLSQICANNLPKKINREDFDRMLGWIPENKKGLRRNLTKAAGFGEVS